jgi:hypothetical protein
MTNKERNLTGRGRNDIGREGDSITLLLGGGDWVSDWVLFFF